MSATPDETVAPVRQASTTASASVSDTSLGPLNTLSANKISVLHGVTISGLELALTLGNAINEDALFRLNSLPDMVFGGSAVMEAVGFLFAVGMAVRALKRPATAGVVAAGVPAMVYAEQWFATGSPEEMDDFWGYGLMAQTLCFFVYAVVSWITSPSSLPAISPGTWILLALVLAGVLVACYNQSQAGRSNIPDVLNVLRVSPLFVEVTESILLFRNRRTTFAGYLLAVLDLVIAAPTVCLYFFTSKPARERSVDQVQDPVLGTHPL